MTSLSVLSDAPTPGRRRAVRLVFAAALLALPVQVAVREIASEPYPGLYQPSFGGVPRSSDQATTSEPLITLEHADGSVRELSLTQALPPTRILAKDVLERGFATQARADDPRTVQWLRERYAADPASTVTAFDVQWQLIGYSLQDGTRSVVSNGQHVRVDLAGAP